MKRIAIHQPNFLPWMGYFHKMRQCDQFVYLDHVPFSKGSFTNRVKIHLPPDKETWLTVPLKSFTLGTPINEIIIDRTQDFESRMLGQLTKAYGNSPVFDEVLSFFQDTAESLKNIDILSTYNIAWIDKILSKLNLSVDLILSSSLPVEGKKDDLIMSICEALEATGYISGMGAKKYMNEEAFAQKGIAITFSNYVEWQNSQTSDIPTDLMYKSILSWLFKNPKSEF